MPSPWVQRMQRQGTYHAASVATEDLGDRVRADLKITVTNDTRPDFDPTTGEAWDATGDVSDWTGTSDYWHLVRRGL